MINKIIRVYTSKEIYFKNRFPKGLELGIPLIDTPLGTEEKKQFYERSSRKNENNVINKSYHASRSYGKIVKRYILN